MENSGTLFTTYWYILAASFAFLVPTGFIFISVAGLEAERAWDAALGGLAAIGLASFGYWAVGFAIQFGGVGLVYRHPELQSLIWEWSAMPLSWGIDWGMAGLSGWFLSGPEITPMIYALFLAHLPWAITTALLPMIALRGRAPSLATLLIALLIGGFLYPMAGNWVQGGGWLSALGRNLNLGHGFVDFGGSGSVHLVATGFALAALVVWVPRKEPQSPTDLQLPAVQMPMLAVVGSLLILAGNIGWLWSNPLQVTALGELALLRGSVSSILFAGGGVLIPLLYTWFVAGRSDPMMSARGLAAGIIAGAAVGPFVQPGTAFLIGLSAGATVPFVTFIVDGLLRLNDATGVISISGVPAMIGLLSVGIWADGVVGRGWQQTGVESYLGVTGQGVSGIFTASRFQPDFPSQLQAQVIGTLTLSLWGFLVGIILCAPLGLLFYALQRTRSGQEGSTQYDIPSTIPETAQFQTHPTYPEPPTQQPISSQYPVPHPPDPMPNRLGTTGVTSTTRRTTLTNRRTRGQ